MPPPDFRFMNSTPRAAGPTDVPDTSAALSERTVVPSAYFASPTATDEQADSDRERNGERTLRAEQRDDDPDRGGDRDDAPEHPSGGDLREGDPESCDEEREECQMDQHAAGLIRDLSHGGDRHDRNQGDRCDRRGSPASGGSDVGAIHRSQA